MAATKSKTLAEHKLDRLKKLQELRAGKEINEKQMPTHLVYDRLRDPNNEPITPNPGPQTTFLDLPDENLDVFYGGSAGGGKSFALFVYAMRACARWPGLQAFWFRRTFPELEQSVLRMLSRFDYGKAIGCTWNESKRELRFANGSILTFAHAKNIQEATSLRSAEIQLLILDERTTVPPDVIDLLYVRVRSGVAGVPCLGVRSASNPGGPGHGRVRSEFVEATDYGQKDFIDRYGRRRIFIQASVRDTPQLGDEYLASLEGLPEDLRKAFLEGDWSVFAGQVFGELRRDRHVVAPLDLPASWRRYCGVDWGWSKPWCAIWGALDEDDRLWVYREQYEAKVLESDQAKRILKAEADAGDDVLGRFADDAMWAARGEARTIAAIYEDEGCHIEKAGKGTGSRLAGITRIHSFLAEMPACRMHREMGWETCPKMHIFSTCKDLFRELENLPHATTGNVEDSDGDADDHAVDALKYMLVNISNEPKWFFQDYEAREKLLADTPSPHAAQEPVKMIAGFPILEGSSPWGF